MTWHHPSYYRAQEQVLEAVRDLAPRDAERLLKEALEQATAARKAYEQAMGAY